jgi:hypothetical protein
MNDFELTPYGFRWGPMYVEHCFSDERHGVVLRVSTKPFPESCERYVEIRISPSGKIMTVKTKGRVRHE